MDIISTRAVAEVLGVSEATVKRWSDAGTLRCFRTPGGHRKFRLRDVKAFLSDQQDTPGEAKVVAPVTALTPVQRQARALALAGDVDALVSLVASQRLQGVSLAEVFDDVFQPAMADIGEAWARGALSAAQEHIATAAVADMVARVRPLVERSARTERGKALCACVAGEEHDLAVRMLALVLSAEGFHAMLLGANVPAGDLAMMMAGSPPAVLALSASSHADPERVKGDLAVLASAAAASKTPVLAGGAGFMRLAAVPSNVRRFGSMREMLTFSSNVAPAK